jgi:replicative superfamily II helicase
MFGHETLSYNPLQRETIKYVEDDCNLIVLAPTSSGKTVVAEQFIQPTIEKGEKAIYLSPLKALTQEKLDDWSSKVASITAITGDHVHVTKAVQQNLVLMTTEALDSKTRGDQAWLYKVGTIVSDESHLLASVGRGDAFEVGLTRFSLMNPDARIIFLSATIPNTKVLADWLTRLNGKPTKVVETDWRPVKQEHHLKSLSGNYYFFLEEAMCRINEILKRHKTSQVLIFVHTINHGLKISQRFKIPFHYSKVGMDERHRIESGYRKGSIRRLVATSTLAFGMNLPADVGVIVGNRRGPMPVSPADIKQEAGRIGRYGLSENGVVYYLFPEDNAEEVYDQVLNTPDIESVLPSRLYFHVCSFVAREGMQRGEINDFLSKTLGVEQFNLKVNDAIETLKDYDALVEDNGGLRATKIGRASALMYLDPIDLYYWRENFMGKPMTPTAIAKAFADIPSNHIHTFVPKSLDNPIDLAYGQASLIATCVRDWIGGRPMEGMLYSIIPPIIKDIDRIVSGMKLAGLHKAYIDNFYMMIKHGVDDRLLELISINGIGRKRAKALAHKNIRTKKEIVDNEVVSRNILGPKLYNAIKESITAPGKIRLIF